MSQPQDIKQQVLDRLRAGDPGWPIWKLLVEKAGRYEFERRTLEYLGTFLIGGGGYLVFKELEPNLVWPDWLPKYVPALYGLIYSSYDGAGLYAGIFDNAPAERDRLFSPAGDEQTGFETFDPPAETYYFQTNDSGAMFFLNKRLEVVYPNAETQGFVVLDALDAFTKTCIERVFAGKNWYGAYAGKVKASLLD